MRGYKSVGVYGPNDQYKGIQPSAENTTLGRSATPDEIRERMQDSMQPVSKQHKPNLR